MLNVASRHGTHNKIQFCLDGVIHGVSDFDPTMSLLDWLRFQACRTGTKEGCAEGDCGSCTVLVGTLLDDRILWRAVNACILFLPMVDSKALITVESLAKQDDLHPLQSAMVELHGSQCGFCTPGFIVSMYGRTIGAAGTGNASIDDVLAGNLCRCTGYGPIIAAANAVPLQLRDDASDIKLLRSIARKEMLHLIYDDPLAGVQRHWFTPTSVSQLSDLLLRHPDARVVAGATDVGLWVTKQHRMLETIVYIGEVTELNQLIESENEVVIGAGVRYNDAHAALYRLHPDLGLLVRRIGAVQVRNAGTIGGNIANGSPIGDMPPALIAFEASLTLRRGDVRRTIPLEKFFLEYGKQDRKPSEFVESVSIPRPKNGDIIRIVKLSKRFDSDISAVCSAILIRLEAGRIVHARIAFGGMAGIPKRASHCESQLIGSDWSASTLELAAQALAKDFTPLTDVRGSAAYRLKVAGNLLRRLWLEQDGTRATVFDVEAVHG